MQSNSVVVKFNKTKRVRLEGSGEEANITRGKKYNKTKRGGGTKGAFLEAPTSSVNQGAYYIQHEG